MSGADYPFDEENVAALKKIILPREPPDDRWKYADKIIIETVESYLSRSGSLEEFIRFIDHDLKSEEDAYRPTVMVAVRDKVADYLKALTEAADYFIQDSEGRSLNPPLAVDHVQSLQFDEDLIGRVESPVQGIHQEG
jgi:hypothetical protein